MGKPILDNARHTQLGLAWAGHFSHNFWWVRSIFLQLTVYPSKRLEDFFNRIECFFTSRKLVHLLTCNHISLLYIYRYIDILVWVYVGFYSWSWLPSQSQIHLPQHQSPEFASLESVARILCWQVDQNTPADHVPWHSSEGFLSWQKMLCGFLGLKSGTQIDHGGTRFLTQNPARKTGERERFHTV